MNEKLITAMSEAQIDMKKRQKNMANPKIMPPDLGYNYAVLDQSRMDEIYSLYQSFRGNTEFLYSPPYSEIKENMNSQDVNYIGMQSRSGKLVGVIKVEKLSLPAPFFMPPQYDQREDSEFYGLSGLIIHDDYRRKGLAKYLTGITLNALHIMGATGVYADCDYRNRGSFATLSKIMDFVGFTDARFGAENERTVYMTFYSSRDRKQTDQVSGLEFNFSRIKNLGDVVNVLQTMIDKFGGSNRLKIDYGRKDLGEYNTIYVLRRRLRTADMPSRLILSQEEYIKICSDNNKAAKRAMFLSAEQGSRGRV